MNEVTLEPFFLSKFEMTQAQAERVLGNNPSYFPGPTRPVESLSWLDARTAALRLGLILPTEARWEYACRAGAASPYFFDGGTGELKDYANICGQETASQGIPFYEPWNDGHPNHAPVGLFDANDFGLFDIIGNVSEWCQDAFEPYSTGARDGDGLRGQAAVEARVIRVARGAHAMATSQHARSALREKWEAGSYVSVVGLRPARGVEE